MLLKQSTARNRTVLMVDSADHVTGKTGLTLAIKASKDGGAFATITPTVTELEAGFYALTLDEDHTDTAGDLALHITATGADPTDIIDQVVAMLPGEPVFINSPDGLNEIAGAVLNKNVELEDESVVPFVELLLKVLEQTGRVDPDTTLLEAISEIRDAASATPTAEENAAAVRTEIAPELARIDVATSTRLAEVDYEAPDNAGIATAIAGAAAIYARTDVATSTRAAAGDAMTLTSGERGSVAAAVMSSVIEGSVTLTKACRAFLSALAAKCSGMESTTATFRDTADAKDRIVATVDEHGNRTTVSLDLD